MIACKLPSTMQPVHWERSRVPSCTPMQRQQLMLYRCSMHRPGWACTQPHDNLVHNNSHAETCHRVRKNLSMTGQHTKKQRTHTGSCEPHVGPDTVPALDHPAASTQHPPSATCEQSICPACPCCRQTAHRFLSHAWLQALTTTQAACCCWQHYLCTSTATQT